MEVWKSAVAVVALGRSLVAGNARDRNHPLQAQTRDRTNYHGIEELWANERYLENYNSDIVRLLSRPLEGAVDVLEFGAGIGTLASLWRASTTVRPECLEIDRTLQRTLTARGFDCHESLKDLPRTFDGIYTSNVLEHIQDDVSVLRQLHAKLRPGARIAIFVPAFMSLYGGADAAVGHYRRYGRRELLCKLKAARFEVLECRFVDSIGFFAWLSLKIWHPHAPPGSANAKSLQLYDKYIYPLSRGLDTLGLKYLFGKNLLAVARKM
jgi:SAM-dependent methyltransferase